MVIIYTLEGLLGIFILGITSPPLRTVLTMEMSHTLVITIIHTLEGLLDILIATPHPMGCTSTTPSTTAQSHIEEEHQVVCTLEGLLDALIITQP